MQPVDPLDPELRARSVGGRAAVCWGFHPDGGLGGVAYVDGEIRGVVDAATWADAVGTDTDADGWLVEEGDCDDADAEVYCYAPEVEANGVDDDCNGVDGTDLDRDGWTADVDCNDTEDEVYPGAPDAVGDGLDSDCDGTDGPAAADTGGGDTAASTDDTARVDSGETGGGETGAPEAAEMSASPSCAVAAPATRAWIGASFAAAVVVRRRRGGSGHGLRHEPRDGGVPPPVVSGRSRAGGAMARVDGLSGEIGPLLRPIVIHRALRGPRSRPGPRLPCRMEPPRSV